MRGRKRGPRKPRYNPPGMDAIPHEHEYDAEVARLISKTGFRCPRCSYQLKGLEHPRCPECGRAVTLRDVGEYGTTEETRTALRLHGPIACRACGERIHNSEDACCPCCHVRIQLGWFPKYQRGPRGLDQPMHIAVLVGGAGIVANVFPAAIFLLSANGIMVLLNLAGLAFWVGWVIRIRRGRAVRRPVLVGAAPWVLIAVEVVIFFALAA